MKRVLIACLILFCTGGAVFFYIPGLGSSDAFSDEKYLSNVQSESEKKKSCYYKEEEALLKFIENNLLGINGEIFSNTKPSRDGFESLSESVGLMMNYCVLRDRKDLFDFEFSYLKNKLLVDGRFIKWRDIESEVTCNAVLDDLRIVRALLDASFKWHDKAYWDTARQIQEGIYQKETANSKLCELYDWKKDYRQNSIPLCYLDLKTIKMMNGFNKGWKKVFDKSLETIDNGRLEGQSPFFYKYYSYVTRSYSLDEEAPKGKGICLTYSLYTALHLAEVKQDTGFFKSWLKDEMNNEKLYAWYNPYTSEPSQNMESTAVYALAAVYSKKAGEDGLYKRLIDRMLRFMVINENSPYYGGFGNLKTGDFYSFDNLTALWALSLAD